MTDRININTLKNQKIAAIKVDADKPQYINFYSSSGRFMFSVDRDQIFTRSGNRFEVEV